MTGPALVPKLSNSEWAKEIRARVEDLNDLLREAPERDVVIEILQKHCAITEIRPVLYIEHIAENL